MSIDTNNLFMVSSDTALPSISFLDEQRLSLFPIPRPFLLSSEIRVLQRHGTKNFWWKFYPGSGQPSLKGLSASILEEQEICNCVAGYTPAVSRRDERQIIIFTYPPEFVMLCADSGIIGEAYESLDCEEKDRYKNGINHSDLMEFFLLKSHYYMYNKFIYTL